MTSAFEQEIVTAFGETRSVKEWADIKGLLLTTVRSRRSRGDTWAKALRPAEKRGAAYRRTTRCK